MAIYGKRRGFRQSPHTHKAGAGKVKCCRMLHAIANVVRSCEYRKVEFYAVPPWARVRAEVADVSSSPFFPACALPDRGIEVKVFVWPRAARWPPDGSCTLLGSCLHGRHFRLKLCSHSLSVPPRRPWTRWTRQARQRITAPAPVMSGLVSVRNTCNTRVGGRDAD